MSDGWGSDGDNKPEQKETPVEQPTPVQTD